MIEKHIVLEDIDPVILYGAGNNHLQMIRALFPKLRIVARDNVIRVLGDEEQMCAFEENIETMRRHVLKFNRIGEEDILEIVKGKKTANEMPEGVVVYTMAGKPVKPRSEKQQQLVDAFNKSDMVFAVGPAGTGKTYLAVALAVYALKNKEIDKIILTRPAVEAGEKLGFLPGDMNEKVDPYLRPLFDALQEMMGQDAYLRHIERGSIEIAPLAYMRGRTLSNSFIILDEAQNTTKEQMKMFLTRMGENSRIVVTGDVTQIDLPKNVKSGMIDAIEVLDGVEGIEIVKLTAKDVVRHELVTRIIQAYEKAESARAKVAKEESDD